MRSFWIVALAVLVAAGIILLALYLGQRKLLFPAPRVSLPPIRDDRVELIELELGKAILALPFEETRGAPLIVYAHGNAEVAQWSLPSFLLFRQQGFAVLLLEFPGYGGAPGSPSSDSLRRSALLAFDAVAQRVDIDRDRVVVYGRSIGSGVACHLATERDVRAVVLESAFSSLGSLVAEKGLPAFLLRDRFDNAAAVSSLSVPLFLYHGARDTIIPVSHSEKLAGLASDVTFVTAECGHNDCPRPWPELLEFFEAIGLR